MDMKSDGYVTDCIQSSGMPSSVKKQETSATSVDIYFYYMILLKLF
jgi:hypothetical protein